jgi:hypothetical protein
MNVGVGLGVLDHRILLCLKAVEILLGNHVLFVDGMPIH